MEAYYSALPTTFIDRYLTLIATTDARTIVSEHQEFCLLAQDMCNDRIFSMDVYDALAEDSVRNFSRYAFPFMNTVPKVMDHVLHAKEELIKTVQQSTQSSFGKATIIRQLDDISAHRMHDNLLNELTETDFELLHLVARSYAVETVGAYTEEVQGEVQGEVKSVLVKRGDIGAALASTKATLSHIFASWKCYGGGVPSNGILPGGQEEGVFAQNPTLLLIGVCLFGTPMWEGENRGKITWDAGTLLPDKVLYFPFSVERNAWVVFHSAPDYRDVLTVPSDEVQQIKDQSIISTLLRIAYQLSITLVTGEFGTGIYKGSYHALKAAFIAMKRHTMCICVYKDWVDCDMQVVTDFHTILQ